ACLEGRRSVRPEGDRRPGGEDRVRGNRRRGKARRRQARVRVGIEGGVHVPGSEGGQEQEAPCLGDQLGERPVRDEDVRGDREVTPNPATVATWPAGKISATSRSSRTSITARRPSSTRCCGNPAPSGRTRTSTSASWTRWSSSARR